MKVIKTHILFFSTFVLLSCGGNIPNQTRPKFMCQLPVLTEYKIDEYSKTDTSQLSSYYYHMNLEDFSLFSEPSLDAGGEIIDSATAAFIEYSNDKEWIKIITEKGKVGWILNKDIKRKKIDMRMYKKLSDIPYKRENANLMENWVLGHNNNIERVGLKLTTKNRNNSLSFYDNIGRIAYSTKLSVIEMFSKYILLNTRYYESSRTDIIDLTNGAILANVQNLPCWNQIKDTIVNIELIDTDMIKVVIIGYDGTEFKIMHEEEKQVSFYPEEFFYARWEGNDYYIESIGLGDNKISISVKNEKGKWNVKIIETLA